MHTYPFPIMIEYVKIQFYFSELKSVQNRPTIIRFQENYVWFIEIGETYIEWYFVFVVLGSMTTTSLVR